MILINIVIGLKLKKSIVAEIKPSVYKLTCYRANGWLFQRKSNYNLD